MSMEALNLPDDVDQLKAMIAERDASLAAQSVALAERDASLAAQSVTIAEHQVLIEHHETIIAAQHDTIEKQLKKLAGLEQQLARLLRKHYGPQKERINPDQLTLFTAEELTKLAEELQRGVVDSVSIDDGSPSDDEDAGEQGASSQKSKHKGRKGHRGHGRRPLPDHLPREVVTHELSEAQRACPCCGTLRREIGSEVSEQLEYIPASLKVVQHHRKKYACAACEENVTIAPKPAQPVEKGLPGPGLLAHTILSKYGDYLPLYRQEDILSRHGILIRRSTLCDWVAAAADLLRPLYELMCDRVRASHVIHTDDTSIKMLEPGAGACRGCKFWTYIGDAANPFTVYEFSLTREGENPSRFLKDFVGYLQADAFSGYDRVYASGKVIEVACMAHCRRYWWEAKDTDSRRAHEAISYIARLYALEEQFDNSTLIGDARRDARRQHALPILNAFEIWLRSQQMHVLPKSEIAKAFTYTLNQWEALCRYTQDGALSIDNNLAERQVKLPAIGRKNWLFVGSKAGGERAAILLSMIASAKLIGVDPWPWLHAVMRQLPRRRAEASQPIEPSDLPDLLPDAWLKANPQHRWEIDDLRQKERERSRQMKISKRNQR